MSYMRYRILISYYVIVYRYHIDSSYFFTISFVISYNDIVIDMKVLDYDIFYDIGI